MASLMDGDGQPARRTGVLALINFPYQELTWKSFHRPLMRLGGRREERIFSVEDNSSGGVEEARIRTLRDFRPQPLRSQPEEMIQSKEI